MLDFSEMIIHHLADHRVKLGPVTLFSKHLLMMWIAGTIATTLILLGVHGKGRFASRVRLVLDIFVEFIKNDIVDPYLKEDGHLFFPYLLTLFLSIFLMNLIGLVPFGSTATGNISVTAGLSILTFILIHVSGIRKFGFFHHFHNIIPSGIPLVLAPFIFLLEMVGFITKTLALCIRLFANMTAGHLVVLLFLGIIILFGQQKPSVGFVVAPVSLSLTLGLYGLELIVALIQAYVFTMLTAIFIGGSLHPEH